MEEELLVQLCGLVQQIQKSDELMMYFGSGCHSGSLNNNTRTSLGKLGIKHTLQFQIMSHLGLYHLFKLGDAIILNSSVFLSLPFQFKDFLLFA